MVKPYEATCDS